MIRLYAIWMWVFLQRCIWRSLLVDWRRRRDEENQISKIDSKELIFEHASSTQQDQCGVTCFPSSISVCCTNRTVFNVNFLIELFWRVRFGLSVALYLAKTKIKSVTKKSTEILLHFWSTYQNVHEKLSSRSISNVEDMRFYSVQFATTIQQRHDEGAHDAVRELCAPSADVAIRPWKVEDFDCTQVWNSETIIWVSLRFIDFPPLRSAP